MREKLVRLLERAFRAFAVRVISAYARVRFNAHKTLEDGAPDEGAVVLCSHASLWDFCYLIYALSPRRARIVATSIEFEKNRVYAWMLRALGVIPKMQGAADMACVRSMVRACQSGDAVALFPQGMTSHDGRPAWHVQPGTGKLVRMMGASVYALVADGAFLSHARYIPICRRGRVEIRLRRLFTADEVRAMSPEDAQDRIEAALTYNDWTWQETARVRCFRRAPVKGVTKTLYMCPDCGMIGGMEEISPRIRCRVCGMTAERDEYGFFRAVTGKCPARMDEWADMEIQKLKEETASDGFMLCAPVTLRRPTGRGAGYADADEGELTMTKTALTFRGKARTLVWSLKDFQYFVMNDVNFLHIYAVNGAYRFVFTDPRLITRWFFAHRLLVGGI